MPSGTSSAVGPSFFVGRSAEVIPNRSSHQTTSTVRRFGWAGLGATALLVVAALEWQTWLGAKPAPEAETAAVAASSVQSEGRAAPPAVYPAARPIAAPTSGTITKASATAIVPAVPVVAEVAEKVPAASTTPKAQVADNEADAQNELDNDSSKVKLLRTAMSRGDADAPVSLANLYLEGKEVSRSCDQAVSLLESAAAKANARARNRLAAMYEIGTCVERDRVQAYRWLSEALAVDRNNAWAQQNRDQTWREMTPEERTMAEAYR